MNNSNSTAVVKHFQYTLAKCPLSGGHTSSDWWYVLSRHVEYDSAQDALAKIPKYKKLIHKYMVFELHTYSPGQQFNIKTVHKLKR